MHRHVALAAWLALPLASPAFAQPAAPFSAAELAERSIHRRAVEAVVWGMPAVNYDLMLQEMLTKTGGKVNQVVFWGRPLDWRNQTLTPNPDTIYFMAFFNTKEVGPLVLEVPPADATGSLNGNIVTAWQTALEDVGLLGLDKGAGGKFLILPPGYDGSVPDGYTALPSDTHGGYALLRSSLRSHGDADVAAAIAYGRRVKLYPLSAAGNPPATVFTDAKDVEYDSTIRYDLSFFRSLDRVVQGEPWIERDRAMIDPLRSIGIEQGKPFAPDEATQAVLTAAIGEAEALLEQRYAAGFPPFWEGSHWTMPALAEAIEGQATTYAEHDRYAIDARGLAYTYAYIAIKRLGAGQFYLIAIRDQAGAPFEGGKTYRLTVPPGVPIEQYWSVTAYDRETHALIRDMARASRSSQLPELQKNADGSIDVHFGPEAPAGKETNWVPTDPGGGFELMFRLYAPRKEFFDKVWRLPDVERIEASSTDAEAPPSGGAPVTPDNFTRAESDLYFGNVVKDDGFGRFFHHREPTPVDKQPVIRMNRDTLYSGAVFDLDAGPVTITLPDAGERFMSMQVIDEDQYTPQVVYGAGSHTLAKERIGTRYVLAAVRTLVDPADPKDVAAVHALQDAIRVEQPGGPGRFEVPAWDQRSQTSVREALLALAATLPDTKGMFGRKGEVDPVRRLIGSASAWGGNPERDALYLNVTPARNDGATVYRLDVEEVPVDGFWSISVYDAKGYFAPNKENAYTLNNITAKKGADGSVAVQFGGCDGGTVNCLPVTPGWNYLVRLYRPRAELLDGSWKFPEPRPVP